MIGCLWFARLWGPFLGEALEGVEDTADVGLIWIELSAMPFQHLGVLFVFWVSHGFEEVSVTGEATDVLWGTGPDSSDKARVFGPRNGIIDFLDLDHMVPVVAKVVDVMDGLGAHVFEHIQQFLHLRGILAGDVVYVRTGWGDHWKDPDTEKKYYASAPGLSYDAAKLLGDKRIVAMLEGGYVMTSLARSVGAHLRSLADL